MKKLPYVRVMLVDGQNHRLIKAIKTLDLIDYIALIPARKDNINVVCDFSKVIEHLHQRLNISLGRNDTQALNIERDAVFQKWMRYRAASSRTVKEQMGTIFLSDTQDALTRVSAAMRTSKSAYSIASDHSQAYWSKSDKTVAFSFFVSHIDTLIEIFLCNIHVTAGEDVRSFRNDISLCSQINSTAEIIVKCLESEMQYWQDGFSHRSVINQCVMEDMGIDISALMELMRLDFSTEQIKKDILATQETYTDGNLRVRRCSWQEAEPSVLARVKVLAELLQKLRALEALLVEIKEHDYEFDGSPEATSAVDNLIINLANQEREALQFIK